MSEQNQNIAVNSDAAEPEKFKDKISAIVHDDETNIATKGLLSILELFNELWERIVELLHGSPKMLKTLNKLVDNIRENTEASAASMQIMENIFSRVAQIEGVLEPSVRSDEEIADDVSKEIEKVINETSDFIKETLNFEGTSLLIKDENGNETLKDNLGIFEIKHKNGMLYALAELDESKQPKDNKVFVMKTLGNKVFFKEHNIESDDGGRRVLSKPDVIGQVDIIESIRLTKEHLTDIKTGDKQQDFLIQIMNRACEQSGDGELGNTIKQKFSSVTNKVNEIRNSAKLLKEEQEKLQKAKLEELRAYTDNSFDGIESKVVEKSGRPSLVLYNKEKEVEIVIENKGNSLVATAVLNPKAFDASESISLGEIARWETNSEGQTTQSFYIKEGYGMEKMLACPASEKFYEYYGLRNVTESINSAYAAHRNTEIVHLTKIGTQKMQMYYNKLNKLASSLHDDIRITQVSKDMEYGMITLTTNNGDFKIKFDSSGKPQEIFAVRENGSHLYSVDINDIKLGKIERLNPQIMTTVEKISSVLRAADEPSLEPKVHLEKKEEHIKQIEEKVLPQKLTRALQEASDASVEYNAIFDNGNTSNDVKNIADKSGNKLLKSILSKDDNMRFTMSHADEIAAAINKLDSSTETKSAVAEAIKKGNITDMSKLLGVNKGEHLSADEALTECCKSPNKENGLKALDIEAFRVAYNSAVKEFETARTVSPSLAPNHKDEMSAHEQIIETVSYLNERIGKGSDVKTALIQGGKDEIYLGNGITADLKGKASGELEVRLSDSTNTANGFVVNIPQTYLKNPADIAGELYRAKQGLIQIRDKSGVMKITEVGSSALYPYDKPLEIPGFIAENAEISADIIETITKLQQMTASGINLSQATAGEAMMRKEWDSQTSCNMRAHSDGRIDFQFFNGFEVEPAVNVTLSSQQFMSRTPEQLKQWINQNAALALQKGSEQQFYNQNMESLKGYIIPDRAKESLIRLSSELNHNHVKHIGKISQMNDEEFKNNVLKYGSLQNINDFGVRPENTSQSAEDNRYYILNAKQITVAVNRVEERIGEEAGDFLKKSIISDNIKNIENLLEGERTAMPLSEHIVSPQDKSAAAEILTAFREAYGEILEEFTVGKTEQENSKENASVAIQQKYIEKNQTEQEER